MLEDGCCRGRHAMSCSESTLDSILPRNVGWVGNSPFNNYKISCFLFAFAGFTFSAVSLSRLLVMSGETLRTDGGCGETPITQPLTRFRKLGIQAPRLLARLFDFKTVLDEFIVNVYHGQCSRRRCEELYGCSPGIVGNILLAILLTTDGNDGV